LRFRIDQTDCIGSLTIAIIPAADTVLESPSKRMLMHQPKLKNNTVAAQQGGAPEKLSTRSTKQRAPKGYRDNWILPKAETEVNIWMEDIDSEESTQLHIWEHTNA
jgi:hypothetical protein